MTRQYSHVKKTQGDDFIPCCGDRRSRRSSQYEVEEGVCGGRCKVCKGRSHDAVCYFYIFCAGLHIFSWYIFLFFHIASSAWSDIQRVSILYSLSHGQESQRQCLTPKESPDGRGLPPSHIHTMAMLCRMIPRYPGDSFSAVSSVTITAKPKWQIQSSSAVSLPSKLPRLSDDWEVIGFGPYVTLMYFKRVDVAVNINFVLIWYHNFPIKLLSQIFIPNGYGR